ncbi:uncharacterized protein UTRI_02096 [Ustilago trichophora]|uniref:Uncharacterized protein n=1 Tax=Ustilago trichophora TaxID=86804 RepID=A0A5C3DYY1_9BASI|nr:uncharacterized protein UTRI_02096 [Ustilago trichophora]
MQSDPNSAFCNFNTLQQGDTWKGWSRLTFDRLSPLCTTDDADVFQRVLLRLPTLESDSALPSLSSFCALQLSSMLLTFPRPPFRPPTVNKQQESGSFRHRFVLSMRRVKSQAFPALFARVTSHRNLPAESATDTRVIFSLGVFFGPASPPNQ